MKKCQNLSKWFLFALGCGVASLSASPENSSKQPNIVMIFVDDMGYNDIGAYGSEKIKTPHLDRMAEEGRKFTSFYVASSICTPSRAALMTGSYANRVGMGAWVVFPQHKHGLHPDEDTMGDVMSRAGYATAYVGKWHLGHAPGLLPHHQGFDSYYGIPYSNDMAHPDDKGKPFGQWDASWKDQAMDEVVWKTPLMQDDEIIELPVDQRTITRRYTDAALRFMGKNRDGPFFLFLSHSMPHVPLYVPPEWHKPDPKHAYTRTIEHIDDEVGRILDALRESGLKDNTYVIFTSDNGPWRNLKNDPKNHHAGSAKPFRGGKFTTLEGGHRVPFLVWGPDTVPAGTESDAFLTAMDLLPTFAAMGGGKLEPRGVLDGFEAQQTLLGDAPSPRDEFLYYAPNGHLEAIRQNHWKLRRAGADPELYDLSRDLGESKNLADEHPEKVSELTARMKALNEDVERNKRSRFN